MKHFSILHRFTKRKKKERKENKNENIFKWFLFFYILGASRNVIYRLYPTFFFFFFYISLVKKKHTRDSTLSSSHITSSYENPINSPAISVIYIFEVKSLFERHRQATLHSCRISLIVRKHTFSYVRPTKIQINLRIRTVWSESSLLAWRNLASLAIKNAPVKSQIRLRWAHMFEGKFSDIADIVITA